MKIIDDLLLTSHVLYEVNTKQLQEFLNSNANKRELISLANQYPDKTKLCLHFKDSILVPWWLAAEHLQCSKYELNKYKQQLGYANSFYISNGNVKGYRDYYFLGKVLEAKDTLETLRKSNSEELKFKRRQAAKKASQTKKDRQQNMPSFIKDNNCVFEQHITAGDIKKNILLALLNHEPTQYVVKFKFGYMQWRVIITSNDIRFQPKDMIGQFWEYSNMKFNSNTINNKIEQKINNHFKTLLNRFYFNNYENKNYITMLKNLIEEKK